MSPADAPQVRAGGRLLMVLFWVGVALAPLAAVLLLVGQGSRLVQVAAVLGVLAVVLIGLSITLRRDPETRRSEIEGLVFDEVDALRADIRADIAHAARATHKALSEQIVTLNSTVDELRGQLIRVRGECEALRGQCDMLRGQLERAAPPAGMPPVRAHVASASVPGGLLRHTETVRVTTRHTTVVDPSDTRRDGTVYGTSRPAVDVDASVRDEATRVGRRRSGDIPQQRRGELPAAREESWTEQMLRERLARRQEPVTGTGLTGRGGTEYRTGDVLGGRFGDESKETTEGWRLDTGDRHHEITGGWGIDPSAGHHETTGGWGAAPAEDHHETTGGWRQDSTGDLHEATGFRSTTRWASVRSDDRGGRELHLGERRAAIQADESSAQLRIEGRWASVRDDNGSSRHPDRQSWRVDDVQPPRVEPATTDVARHARHADDDHAWHGSGDSHDGARALRRMVDFSGTDDRWR